jgi:hypothetical protein
MPNELWQRTGTRRCLTQCSSRESDAAPVIDSPYAPVRCARRWQILKKILLMSLFLISVTGFAKGGCGDVDRSISEEQKKQLAPVIAAQLHVEHVEVLESYRYNEWSIIYVETYETENTFVFFNGNPVTQPYVTTWSGVASAKEERKILQWVFKSAPGIPVELARCFAWHVTHER